MSVRPAAGAVALVLGLTLLAPAAPASSADDPRPPGVAARQVDAPVPALAWGPCPDLDEPEGRAECATATVPLDYDEPEGETVDLDLLRMPATDPAQRIGTLFVNPGGPGGSSRSFASYFHYYVPDVVAERFDVVGIDPRGVGPSAPMTCRTSERPPRAPRHAFPVNAKQAQVRIASDEWFRDACRTEPAPIVDHMTTADTARDMDLVRQALGDEQLTFYGISYGTQLAATYVAMFPDRVRAVIADGVLDPEAWTGPADPAQATRPFSERLGSGVGAWQSLTAALSECDRVGPARCPIAGRAHEVWDEIIDRLERGPFRFGKHQGSLRYADVVASAVSALYDPYGVRSLMRTLKRTHRAMFDRDARTVLAERSWRQLARRATDRRLPGPYGSSARRVSDAFAGVACADSANPADPRAWIRAGKRADRRSPWFGRFWTWASSRCAGWPASAQEDRFTGSYAVTTSAPVLVVGNSYDPATPIHGARALNRLLDGSRLLMLDGWGHGALGYGDCIGDAYAAYLVDRTLPRAGTVCQPGEPLFGR